MDKNDNTDMDLGKLIHVGKFKTVTLGDTVTFARKQGGYGSSVSWTRVIGTVIGFSKASSDPLSNDPDIHVSTELGVEIKLFDNVSSIKGV